ncbi:MAG: LemA family protein [Chitinispirillaceae bacterium]
MNLIDTSHIPIILIAGVVVYTVVTYNGLVQLKNNVAKAWSNISVLLKQRYDEIPNLVRICEAYMKHERATLEKVIQARSLREQAEGPEQQAKASNSLSSALSSLFAVSENYPQLKADANFRQLQACISELEDQIADRREFYNESVTVYNVHIQKFPDSVVAASFNFSMAHLWKINPLHRENTRVFISAGRT